MELNGQKEIREVAVYKQKDGKELSASFAKKCEEFNISKSSVLIRMIGWFVKGKFDKYFK